MLEEPPTRAAPFVEIPGGAFERERPCRIERPGSDDPRKAEAAHAEYENGHGGGDGGFAPFALLLVAVLMRSSRR